MTTTSAPTTNTSQAQAKSQVKAAPTRKSDTGQVLRRLIGYMIDEENRLRMALATLALLLSIIALIAIPRLAGDAINVLGTGGSVEQMRSLIIWVIVCCAAYILLSVYADRQLAFLATRGLSKLQNHLFEHMQSLSLSFFDRQPLGQLVSRVTNDAETVALFYESAVAQIIQALLQILLILGVMLITDWRLTIAALLVVPVLLYVTSTVERVSSPAFARLQEELGNISGFQEETITGNKVIISCRRQDWAGEQNEKLADGVFDVASKAYFAALLQFPVTSVLILVQSVIVLIFGGILVIDGKTDLGTVTAFAAYSAMLGTPLSDLSNLLSTALAAVAGGRRVFEVIDEQPTVVDAPGVKDYQFQGGHVEFKDVDFSYVKGRKILKHNSFEALPGQKIGICGPTGAGKSTIINILTRYYDIDSGMILLDGQDIHKLTQVSLRQQIGVVLQEAFLFTDTVMNNLKYARPDATDEECIQAAQQANAHEFITRLPKGYQTMMTERGANLSQGQRQMLTIARAMVANPRLLVLDEATSNVDTRTEKLIQQGLQRLMAGRTSFVIAHRLSTIRDSARILVVNGGEIVESGPHDELMAAKGFYYALYMSQFKGKLPGGQAAASADFIST
jgi:ATP-binding cassette subfamily B protein